MSTSPSSTLEAVLNAVEVGLEGAVSDLAAVSGDASLCYLSRSGGPVSGVKYHEGRVSALRELRRGCRRGEQESLERTLREWRAEQERYADRPGTDPWKAYRTGGVDALLTVSEAVSPDAT